MSLASGRVPLIRCLVRPRDALKTARLGGTEAELAAEAAARNEAAQAAERAKQEAQEELLRVRRPDRDIEGRRLIGLTPY